MDTLETLNRKHQRVTRTVGGKRVGQACRSWSFSGPGTSQSLGAGTGLAPAALARTEAISALHRLSQQFPGCHSGPKRNFSTSSSGDKRKRNRGDKNGLFNSTKVFILLGFWCFVPHHVQKNETLVLGEG